METTSENQTQNRGWIVALGILLIVLGIAAIGARVFVSFTSVYILGLILLIGGALQLVQAFFRNDWGDFFLYVFSGVLAVTIGGYVVLVPEVSVELLSFLMAVFFLVGGIAQVFASFLSRSHNWFLGLIAGLVSVFLAFLVFFNWPVSGTTALGWFIGIMLVTNGVLTFLSGFRNKPTPSLENARVQQSISYSQISKGGDKK